MRPKLTLADFRPDWKEQMIAYATEGASDVEIRAEVLDGICHETWTRFIKEEPEFSETVKKCKLLCQTWWEKQGRLGLYAEKFNATTWIFNMKNRFSDDWKDKHSQEHDIGGGFDAFIKSLELNP